MKWRKGEVESLGDRKEVRRNKLIEIQQEREEVREDFASESSTGGMKSLAISKRSER
jgi:hypothetical protein